MDSIRRKKSTKSDRTYFFNIKTSKSQWGKNTSKYGNTLSSGWVRVKTEENNYVYKFIGNETDQINYSPISKTLIQETYENLEKSDDPEAYKEIYRRNKLFLSFAKLLSLKTSDIGDESIEYLSLKRNVSIEDIIKLIEKQEYDSLGADNSKLTAFKTIQTNDGPSYIKQRSIRELIGLGLRERDAADAFKRAEENLSCPLIKSGELMKEPVMCSSGVTYEKNEIQRWIDENKGETLCPCNKTPITNVLIPNIFAIQTINEFVQKYKDQMGDIWKHVRKLCTDYKEFESKREEKREVATVSLECLDQGSYITVSNSPGGQAFSGGVLLSNGNIMFVPYKGKNIGIFNPSTETLSMSFYGIGDGAYSGGVLLPDGNVLCVPYNAKDISILNPTTNEYKLIECMDVKDKMSYSGGVLLPNGNVLLVPFNSGSIGIFDTSDKTYFSGKINPRIENNAYSGGVLLPDDFVVFVPDSAKNIGIFNSFNNHFITISIENPIEKAYSGGVLLPDGRVVFVPFNSKNIGIFKPSTHTFSTIHCDTGPHPAYSGGVLLPDGRVVFVPFNAKNICIFNPFNDTFSLFPYGTGNASFKGGVLLPDGRVVFVPFNSRTIGLFTPPSLT